MLSQDVYQALLERLLNGTIKPGTKLNRRQVSSELGVSVAPVMEAFIQLEHEGFLVTRPRKGTSVRILTKQDVKGHLILKEAIECAAAESYSSTDVQKHYKRLYIMALRIDNEYPIKNTIEAWRLDLAFHAELVALAQYDILTAEFKRIMVPNLFYQINQMLKSNTNESHVKLLDALASEDRDHAIAFLKRHLRSGKLI